MESKKEERKNCSSLKTSYKLYQKTILHQCQFVKILMIVVFALIGQGASIVQKNRDAMRVLNNLVLTTAHVIYGFRMISVLKMKNLSARIIIKMNWKTMFIRLIQIYHKSYISHKNREKWLILKIKLKNVVMY